MQPIERSLLALVALESGDHGLALEHLALADRDRRDRSRRDRQLVEIVAVLVSGDAARATDLAREHAARFPADSALLGVITRERPRGPRSS